MNAICLIVDRLHAGYLGAYGNSWIETPSLDRLASQSFLLDQMLIDSPELQRLYRSYWLGWHAMCPSPNEPRPSLPALLRERGVTTALMTDEPLIGQHPLAVEFDELIEIDPAWQPRPAEEVEQTHFGRCFVQMIEWLEQARGPYFLWCHLAGLGTTWDAPWQFRETYWDEGDPPPPSSAEVPDYRLAQNFDPDEVLGVTQAYCGQVSLFDTCFGAFADFLDSLPDSNDSVLALASPRGFPLGEHGGIGATDSPLFSELVHVPCMLRLPARFDRGVRMSALAEPADLWATLLDLYGVAQTPRSPTAGSLIPIFQQETVAIRDRLAILGLDGQRAIRTPAWYLRSAEQPELFAKPDDRWEANNVACRCGDVVEQLQDTLIRYEQSLPASHIPSEPPLGEVLLHGLE